MLLCGVEYLSECAILLIHWREGFVFSGALECILTRVFSEKWTPLYAAARSNHDKPSCIEALIRLRADVNLRNWCDWSLLQLLDVTAMSFSSSYYSNESCALHICSHLQHTQCVALLDAAGAMWARANDVMVALCEWLNTHSCRYSVSPLHDAVIRGNVPLIESLVAQRADVNAFEWVLTAIFGMGVYVRHQVKNAQNDSTVSCRWIE
jgi:hypothetical protein